jgi:hypothetical protein
MIELAPHMLATVIMTTQSTTRRLLVELAKAADEASQAGGRGGSWTDTPGTDALRARYLHLVPGPPSTAQPSDMAAAS